jgi:hypothetical protein
MPSNFVLIEPIQIVSFVFVAIILIFEVLIYRESIKDRQWVRPMFLWILHSAVFYGYLILDRANVVPDAYSYTQWSSLFRLHGYITIAIIDISRWWIHRKLKKAHAHEPVA